ncbi:MAG TPA: hypothetical protein VF113_04730, partial [Stellaceae bacterium]
LSAADGAAFCEHGIYRINYVGSSAGIFSFQVAEGAAGTQSPLSICRNRFNDNIAVAYYLGEDGFYAFDGMTSTPIGEQKVNRFFLNDLNPAYLSMVQGGSVPNRALVYWLYNSSSGQAANGLYDKMIVYHTVLQRWSYIDLAATNAEWGLISVGVGTTLDALDVYGSLDAVPAPLSSGAWEGGTPVLAAFDAAHKLNFINGTYMAPTVETSEMQPTPGRRSIITSARPLIDGGSPSIAVATRDRLLDSPAYGSAVAVNSIGECPQHTTGRYVRCRLTLPAASAFTHLQGVELETRPEGRR